MHIEAWHWRKSQPLAEDYLHQFDRVRHLYEYDPWDDASWVRRAAWLDSHGSRFRANRSKLIEALKSYNERMGGTSETMRSLEHLRDERTLAIVGGQQAGLFGGPALVVWKAVSIIQAARKAEQQLQRPVVPVFWIAGEDHDWEEVNHFHYGTADLKVEKFRLQPADSAGRASVASVAVAHSEWENALQVLSDSLIDTEFKSQLMSRLSSILTASVTLTEQFARIMHWLFGRHGLVLIDSHDAAIRALESEMFARLIERHHEVNHAFLQAELRVRALGATPQAAVAPGQANLFLNSDEERRLLLYDSNAGCFVDKKGEHTYSQDELLRIAHHEPFRLSNNALTRPLMQEHLFPVLGTVLGPAEIAYWGLLKDAFSLFSWQMPLLVPRTEYTLLEGTIQKNMRKYELTFADVVTRLEEVRETWLKDRDTLKLEARFAEVQQSFLDKYEPLLASIETIHGGMKKLADTNKQKIIEQIEFMRERAEAAYKSQFDSTMRQFDRVAAALLPLGKPQERVYNIFAYVNKYDTALVDELVEMPPADVKRHNIVYI